MQKRGFSDKKRDGSQCKLVKLHRPPPDIRIFLPILLAPSSTTTFKPRCPAVRAHMRPAAPPPMMMTSVFTPRLYTIAGNDTLEVTNLERIWLVGRCNGRSGVECCVPRRLCKVDRTVRAIAFNVRVLHEPRQREKCFFA